MLFFNAVGHMANSFFLLASIVSILFSIFHCRDIKHRNLKKPSEPSFNIEKYVESQREKQGCCS